MTRPSLSAATTAATPEAGRPETAETTEPSRAPTHEGSQGLGVSREDTYSRVAALVAQAKERSRVDAEVNGMAVAPPRLAVPSDQDWDGRPWPDSASHTAAAEATVGPDPAAAIAEPTGDQAAAGRIPQAAADPADASHAVADLPIPETPPTSPPPTHAPDDSAALPGVGATAAYCREVPLAEPVDPPGHGAGVPHHEGDRSALSGTRPPGESAAAWNAQSTRVGLGGPEVGNPAPPPSAASTPQSGPSAGGPPAGEAARARELARAQHQDLLALGTPRGDGAGGPPGGLTTSLVRSARETWPPIDRGLLDDVVAAGETAHARARADPRPPVSKSASATALERTEEATEAAVAVSRLGERHRPGQASWTLGGTVIPVLGATAGVGASVVAAALFDALDTCEVPTLLVDAADPARSGLASVVRHQGAPARTLHPKIAIAYARRGGGWVAQLTTPPTEVLSPRMVPSPSWWLPDETPPGATVIDLGWDPWALAAAPLRGVGAWLEAGHPRPRPVLVVEATRPCLAKANQLLTRLQPWITTGKVAPPAALVVTGVKRWPRGIAGVATQALGELLEHAVFLPHDPTTATAGIGPDPVADRLRAAVVDIPARWGLVPDTTTGFRARPRPRLLGGR